MLKWRLPVLCLLLDDETEKVEMGSVSRVRPSFGDLSFSGIKHRIIEPPVLPLSHLGKRFNRPDQYRCWNSRYT